MIATGRDDFDVRHDNIAWRCRPPLACKTYSHATLNAPLHRDMWRRCRRAIYPLVVLSSHLAVEVRTWWICQLRERCMEGGSGSSLKFSAMGPCRPRTWDAQWELEAAGARVRKRSRPPRVDRVLYTPPHRVANYRHTQKTDLKGRRW